MVLLTFVSVPPSPPRVSLPFTPSLELTVSLTCSPKSESAPPLPTTLALPNPPRLVSLPTRPVGVLFAPEPTEDANAPCAVSFHVRNEHSFWPSNL